MKSVIKFFSSIKLAIILLIIITLASVLGTLIAQHRSPEEYQARYGQLADLFNKLQLTKLYQSFWFIGLLFLFALNIIVCTLNRLSPKLKKALHPKLDFHAKDILSLKINEKIINNMSLGITEKKLKMALASRHYRFKEIKKEDKMFLLARKKILGWFGADFVHLGILIILAGGIISGLGGFSTNLALLEGQILQVPKSNFKVKLEKFETEYYPSGSVRDWKSTLTVFEKEKPILTRVIEVNHSLSYKGFVFYQNSYGWNWSSPLVKVLVKKTDDPSFLKKIEAKVGERVSFEDEGIQISILQFIPDFVINEKNEITTRSLQPNNPAAFLEGWQENEKLFSGWIFAKFPDFSRIHSKKETGFSFELKDFEANQFSVIQASKDPGVNFIWLGCVFVMVGLALAFYWPSREIKAILVERHEKTEISAGGVALKNMDTFRSEFEKIMDALSRSK